MQQLPGIKATYPDGGLTLNRAADTGDSVLVVGTAEDGPKHEPIPVQSLQQVTDVFGRFGKGDLVRGVYEVWNATNSAVDVRAMRVGDGSLATLGVLEASGKVTTDFVSTDASGLADPTLSVSGWTNEYIKALNLTAKYEGDEYNQFTIKTDLDRNPSSSNYGRTCVVIYNPITTLQSTFSYDYANPSNTVADVHNTMELVDAINADPNLNGYIVATAETLSAQFEICASGDPDFAYVVPAPGAGTSYTDTASIAASLKEGSAIKTEWNANGTPKKTTIYLHHITTANDSDNDGIPDAVLKPDAFYGVAPVIKVGPVGMTWGSNIPTAGNGVRTLTSVYEIATASGELIGTYGKDFAKFDYTPINRNESQSPGNVAGYTLITADGAGKNASQYKQYVSNGLVGSSSDGVTSTWNFTARLEPDLCNWRTSPADGVNVPDADHDEWAGKLVKTRIYETVDGVTTETRKPVKLSWVSSTGTVQFTDSENLPTAGTIVTIDYSTIAGSLTEYDTRSALEATRGSTNAQENYFVTGSNVYFGGSQDTDIVVTYNFKRDYDVPGDVSLADPVIGKIVFGNPEKQPMIHSTIGTRIGLSYEYMPEWIDPSGTESLAGGANGTSMDGLTLKGELSDAYAACENYDVDIVVPMGARMDSTLEEYSLETGILEEKNAGFHGQLGDFLDVLAENVGETIGVMGVEPASSNSLINVSKWVERLTVPNANDRLRGANFMPTFNSRWVQIVAAEPGVSVAKLGVTGVDYYTDGATTYAGLISSLPANLATTNKWVGRSLIDLRYRLSRKQLTDLLDMRLVPFKIEAGVGPVAVKDLTCAPFSSDYDRLSTLRIVKLVMDIVRSVSSPFIGDLNVPYKRNALYTAINGALSTLTQAQDQSLRAYDFVVRSTVEDQRAGNVYVDLDLVPVFCVDAIHVTVYLKNSL